MIRLHARLPWALALALMAAAPAHADDVVYPPGSRIGLATPPAQTFSLYRERRRVLLHLTCDVAGCRQPAPVG